MGTLNESLRKFSPAIFGIAILCFLLPWVNFSCAGQRVATLTGFELVTGTTIQQQGMYGHRETQKVNSEPLAVAVLLFTILGAAVSFLKSRKASLISSIAGVVSLILFLLLKSKIESDTANQGQGMIQVDYAIGFRLVLILFLAAIGLNGYLYFNSEKEVKSMPSQM